MKNLQKDDVYDWYKKLKAYARVDFVCGLLDLCLPLEIRFFGICIEELGRKQYSFFKEKESAANSFEEICLLDNLTDLKKRCKLILTLPLLYSRNVICANKIFQRLQTINALLESDIFCTKKPSVGSLLQEYLLMLVMAVHHPAFSFHEKTELQSYLNKLYELNEEFERSSLDLETECSSTSDDETRSNLSFSSNVLLNSHPQYITEPLFENIPESVELVRKNSIDRNKRKPLLLKVRWKDNTTTYANKSKEDVLSLHRNLANYSDETVKQFCQSFTTHRLSTTFTRDSNFDFEDYFSQLLKLPHYVKSSSIFYDFFKPSNSKNRHFSPYPFQSQVPVVPPANIQAFTPHFQHQHIANATPLNSSTIRGYQFTAPVYPLHTICHIGNSAIYPSDHVERKFPNDAMDNDHRRELHSDEVLYLLHSKHEPHESFFENSESFPPLSSPISSQKSDSKLPTPTSLSISRAAPPGKGFNDHDVSPTATPHNGEQYPMLNYAVKNSPDVPVLPPGCFTNSNGSPASTVPSTKPLASDIVKGVNNISSQVPFSGHNGLVYNTSEKLSTRHQLAQYSHGVLVNSGVINFLPTYVPSNAVFPCSNRSVQSQYMRHVKESTKKIPSCYNCGKEGHSARQCSEPSIDEYIRPGYHLKFDDEPITLNLVQKNFPDQQSSKTV